MKIYVDSSVIAASLLGEHGSSEEEMLLSHPDAHVTSSLLLEAEIVAVAVRERIEESFARKAMDPVVFFSPHRSLLAEYGIIFRHGYLRGADAYHLACALYLDPKAREIRFLTLDKKQREVAGKIGFRT